jgi:release factor glutamine methyltransferase
MTPIKSDKPLAAGLTLAQAQQALKADFASAGLATPGLDARLLLAHICGLDEVGLVVGEGRQLTASEAVRLEKWRVARLAGMPVSRLLGRRAFYGHDFKINPNVLDPRPDSEILVGQVLADFAGRGGHVLDLGTGSGCLLLSLLKENARLTGLGVDCSPAALHMARINAERLGVRARIALRQSDWFASVSGRFDAIIANPPYIAEAARDDLMPEVRLHDPPLALFGGADGLTPYRQIIPQARHFLKPGGRLYLEIGHNQAAQVGTLVEQAGFAHVEIHKDLAGHDRLIIGE